jgi:aldehyde:ferredoxin oxidoreductase
MSLEKKDLRLLSERRYERGGVKRGYNMRSLHIDVGSRVATEKPVSPEMKAKFVGGKGFGLKLLWDGTGAATKWDSAENEIVIAMGPICGNTNYPGSGKSLVVSI